MTIWKCPISLDENHFTLELPHNARVLTVLVQFDEPYIFVLVDPQIPRVRYSFRLVKSGEDFADVMDYIGTFQLWTRITSGKPALDTWHLFRSIS